MLLSVIIQPEVFYTVFHELTRVAFPEYELKFAVDPTADLNLIIDVTDSGADVARENGRSAVAEGAFLQAAVSIGDFNYTQQIFGPLDNIHKRRRLRRFLYTALSAYRGGRISDYGILTGVRPVKLVHRMLDAGWDETRIAGELCSEHMLSRPTAQRLLTVARNNRPDLERLEQDPQVATGGERRLSLYLGIPFCSSRCYYCSFPGAILTDYARQIPPFVKALQREIAEVGSALTAGGYHIDTIYIGGGTPSVLKAEDWDAIFTQLQAALPGPAVREITFEAGRPDSLDETKLSLLKSWQVDRICLNPQTMRNATLERIGRRHDAGQIQDMVARIRAYGFSALNMDLIIGLPGETLEDYRHSITEVLALAPENVTVHTLAVKKGSQLKIDEGLQALTAPGADVRAGVELSEHLLQEAGYYPYYMYRQKYIREDLDNVGYARPGRACLYNILMMEERQTIVGLGGGASSKFMHPDGSITAYHNPKEPAAYQNNIERHIRAKREQL
jgi:oxygen-independent coproporphyrinogen-3 oxidase